jgi:NAD-dependent SIR2 family protein deacetylase
MIELEPTDQIFQDSPYAGEPECKCSRCGKMIEEEECPLRMWTTNEQGVMDDSSQEYRYCEECQKKSGIVIYNDDDILIV